MTQFNMRGVKTDATVNVLGENKYGFVVHLTDEFDGGELTPGEGEQDAIIERDDNGRWTIIGESNLALSDEDVQNLGAAIERDY